MAAAQGCLNELSMLLKHADADWNLVVRSSTDSAFTFEGETYTPTTSMVLATSTRTYTLPPDFLRMKRMRCITAGFEHIRFTYLDADDPLYIDVEISEDLTTGTTTASNFYFDILGRRSLRFPNFPGTALNIEMMYEARLPTLFIYNGESSSTGSITVDDATFATTAGTATRFLDSNLSVPSVLYLASDAGTGHPIVMGTTAGVDFISVSPLRIGSTGLAGPFPIASFTTDIELELTRTYPYDTDASIGYMLCSAPEVMETHPQLFVAYLMYYIFDKMGNAKAAATAMATYERGKMAFKADMEVRSSGLEFVEAFDPGEYY